MKRFLVVAVAVLAGCSAPVPVEQRTHTHIREYAGRPRPQIFDAVMRTVAREFVSAKDVVQHSDRASGVIVAKGVFAGVSTYDAFGILRADCEFTLTVDVKDGKARYVFDKLGAMSADGTDLSHHAESAEFHAGAESAFVRFLDKISVEIKNKTEW